MKLVVQRRFNLIKSEDLLPLLPEQVMVVNLDPKDKLFSF
jgi:hypothetical protein